MLCPVDVFWSSLGGNNNALFSSANALANSTKASDANTNRAPDRDSTLVVFRVGVPQPPVEVDQVVAAPVGGVGSAVWLERCWSQSCGGLAHPQDEACPILAWNVLATADASVARSDDSVAPFSRLELRLVPDTAGNLGAPHAILEFPFGILPHPRVIATARDSFQVLVALVNGLMYRLEFSAHDLKMGTFQIRVWRAARLLQRSSSAGYRIPVLAHFPNTSADVKPMCAFACSNGVVVVAELAPCNARAFHYGQVYEGIGNEYMPGDVQETVMQPDHGLFSKIKGFLPWSAAAAAAVGGARAAALLEEDGGRWSGVDLSAAQPLCLDSIRLGDDWHFLTWSRDRTLRIWKLGFTKCVRAEVLDAAKQTHAELVVSSTASVAGGLDPVVEEHVGTFFRVFKLQQHSALVLVRLGSTEAFVSRFGVYRLEMSDTATPPSLHFLGYKDFRAELVTSLSPSPPSVLVDFQVLATTNAHEFTLWSLWNRESRRGDFIRTATFSVDSIHKTRPLETHPWIQTIHESEPFASGLQTFEDLTAFIQQCRQSELLRCAYEHYTGETAEPHWTVSEVKDCIFDVLQEQASSNKFQISAQGTMQYENALQLESNRFIQILQRLGALNRTAFALCHLGKSMVAVKPDGWTWFQEAGLFDLAIGHLRGSVDLALLGPSGILPAGLEFLASDSISNQLGGLLDTMSVLTSTWDAATWNWIGQDLQSRLTEPLAINLIALAQELKIRYFGESVEDQSVIASISISALETFVAFLMEPAHAETVLMNRQNNTMAVDEQDTKISLPLLAAIYANLGAVGHTRFRYALLGCLAIFVRATITSQVDESRKLTSLLFGCVEFLRFFHTLRHLASVDSLPLFLSVSHTWMTALKPPTSGASFPSQVSSATAQLIHHCLGQDPSQLAAHIAWHYLQHSLLEETFQILAAQERKSWVLFAWGLYHLRCMEYPKARDMFVRFGSEMAKYRNVSNAHSHVLLLMMGKQHVPEMYEYFMYGMTLFSESGALEQALEMAKLALEATFTMGDGENTTRARQGILASVFRFHLDLQQFDSAYAVLLQLEDKESCRACLKNLITSMCECGQERQLCRFPFHGLEGDVMETLVFNARNSNIAQVPNYYQILYAFSISREDYKSAAKWMYQYAINVRKSRALSAFESLVAQAKALLVVKNALSLVDPLDQWVLAEERWGIEAIEDDAEDLGTTSDHGTDLVVTLEAVRRRYHLCIAHLDLLSFYEDLEMSWKELSCEEAISLLTSAGQYEKAASLSMLFDCDMSKLFCSLTIQCMQAQAVQPRSSACKQNWLLLRRLLEAHESPKHGYACKVLESILAHHRDFHLPQWLLDLFRECPEELLRQLMKHELLDKAATVALNLLREMTEQGTLGKRVKTPSYAVLDQLIAALLRTHVHNASRQDQQPNEGETTAAQRLQEALHSYLTKAAQAVGLP